MRSKARLKVFLMEVETRTDLRVLINAGCCFELSSQPALDDAQSAAVPKDIYFQVQAAVGTCRIHFGLESQIIVVGECGETPRIFRSNFHVFIPLISGTCSRGLSLESEIAFYIVKTRCFFFSFGPRETNMNFTKRRQKRVVAIRWSQNTEAHRTLRYLLCLKRHGSIGQL